MKYNDEIKGTYAMKCLKKIFPTVSTFHFSKNIEPVIRFYFLVVKYVT